MKKLLAALIVVAFVFTAVPAMATTAKVPKNICLGVSGTILKFSLVTSKGGTAVVSGNEKIKHYGIEGSLYITMGLGAADNNYPVHGSGYVKGNIFNFAITSVWLPGTDVQTINLRGKLNLLTGSGTASYSNTGPNYSEQLSDWDLFLDDCSTFDVPSDTVADEILPDDLGASTVQ